MMALLSFGWWAQKLSSVAAQAIYIVAAVACVVLGLAWIRHDAILQERAKAAVQMERARTAQLLVLRRRERAALAIGARAEKDLLQELDILTAENSKLEAKLLKTPVRTVCYPKDIIGELNR